MEGGQRDGATTSRFSGRQFAQGLAAIALAVVLAHAAGAVDNGDSRILYFEPFQLSAPTSATPASRQKSSRARELQFDAYGRRFVVMLEPNDKLSPLLQARTGALDLELYRGRINGVSQSWVRLAMGDGQVQGMLWDGAELYVIEPVAKLRDTLPANTKVDDDTTAIFRLTDVVMTPGAAACGADTSKAASKGTAAYSSLVTELKNTPAVMQALGATRRLEISALGDSLFMDRYGNEAEARAEILRRLNNVDGIFSSQLGVEINVPSIDIGDALSNTTSASSLLDELADLRKRSPNLYSHGLTHLFTGRKLDGATVGIAFMDSVCNRQYSAGLTEASTRSAWVESLIAAHEIGHNFGAPHDGDSKQACASTATGQFLMSPSINGNDRFSSCSLNIMRPTAAAASCITALSSADIEVAADLGIELQVLGREFIWELPIRNVGGIATSDAQAEITLPDVLTIVDAFVVGGTCTSGAGRIHCELGDIVGGSAAVVSLTLRSDVAGSHPIAVDVSAGNESNLANNQGHGAINTQPEVDLAVTLQAPTSIAVGTAFSASLSTTNLSSNDADMVTLTITLPAGVTAASATFNGESCIVGSTTITCTLASLAPGEHAQAVATLTAANAGSAVLHARISSSQFDTVATNDTAEATVSVTGAAQNATQSTGSAGGGGGAIGLNLLALLASLRGLKKRPPRPASQSLH